MFCSHILQCNCDTTTAYIASIPVCHLLLEQRGATSQVMHNPKTIPIEVEKKVPNYSNTLST